jgi:hypothetical protein
LNFQANCPFQIYRWCQAQIEKGTAVNLQNFATIGYQPLRENKRVVYAKLNDNFL